MCARTRTGSVNSVADCVWLSAGSGVFRYSGQKEGADTLEFSDNAGAGVYFPFATRFWYSNQVPALAYQVSTVANPVQAVQTGATTRVAVTVVDSAGQPWTGSLPYLVSGTVESSFQGDDPGDERERQFLLQPQFRGAGYGRVAHVIRGMGDGGSAPLVRSRRLA